MVAESRNRRRKGARGDDFAVCKSASKVFSLGICIRLWSEESGFDERIFLLR
jgi:hypothetical protein